MLEKASSPFPRTKSSPHNDHTPESLVQRVALLSQGCLHRALLPPSPGEASGLAVVRVASAAASSATLALLPLIPRPFPASASPPASPIALPVSFPFPSSWRHLVRVENTRL